MHPSSLIDEVPEEVLSAELALRKKRRKEGRCDYCGRAPTTKPCKMRDRHYDKRINHDFVKD